MTKSKEKIIVCEKFASTEVFKLKEAEYPDSRGNEVLIRTHTFSKYHIIVASGGIQ